MLKYVILATLLIAASSKPTFCNATNGTNATNTTFVCPENHRCCQRGNSTFKNVTFGCCFGMDSVCCSNGACCPKNTRCNITAMRCEPIKMFFLAMPEEFQPSVHATPVHSAKDFAKGFVNGTAVFLAIPSSQICDPLNQQLKDNITLFINTIKNLTLANYEQVLTNLVAIGRDIYTQANVSLLACPAVARETIQLVGKISDHVKADGYITKITTHALSNVMEIFGRASKIQQFFKDAKHFEAGQESGSFFDFLFFHDFHL